MPYFRDIKGSIILGNLIENDFERIVSLKVHNCERSGEKRSKLATREIHAE